MKESFVKTLSRCRRHCCNEKSQQWKMSSNKLLQKKCHYREVHKILMKSSWVWVKGMSSLRFKVVFTISPLTWVFNSRGRGKREGKVFVSVCVYVWVKKKRAIDDESHHELWYCIDCVWISKVLFSFFCFSLVCLCRANDEQRTEKVTFLLVSILSSCCYFYGRIFYLSRFVRSTLK